jgi:4-diphosphocytidyl-2-C-methyl-D-erythritol kinase
VPPTRLLGVPEPVTVRVPAKVNLHLAVGPLRPDGYHELVTVFQAVSLYDEVTATAARGMSVGLRGEGAAELPLNGDNLAWRAAVLLAERVSIEPAVRLDLVKGIPVAAGLAGGSADAAATLVACDALWGTGLDRADLLELAADLGSDVAFALTGGTALGTGRGERLTPVLASGRWHWVFAIAAEGMATSRVYAELDRLRLIGDPPSAGEPDRLINALRAHDPGQAGPLLANDLQAPALSLRAPLRRTLRVGKDLGALGGVVSGSGPTCAFLARSREAAVRLAASLSGAGVCRTVRVAYGPVPGARVVEESAPARR